ncbi:hypothetical protein [Alteromonas sp. CYL-A6]|uniref:hypothetical protein n=1 Tax=Alteromonas nitratireducens TaxID=3390813 RepID=UPI0034B94281
MMKIKTLTLSLMMATASSMCAASPAPVTWLKTLVQDEADIEVAMEKQRFSFKGCRQSQYQLSFTKDISSVWNVEAVAHYNRGTLQFGTLRQQVQTRSVEFIAWWQQSGYRVGLMHKAQPRHRIALPMGDELNLPTSQTSGVYMEMPLDTDENQSIRLAALHQTWSDNDATVSLPWKRNQDNQVSLHYSVAF